LYKKSSVESLSKHRKVILRNHNNLLKLGYNLGNRLMRFIDAKELGENPIKEVLMKKRIIVSDPEYNLNLVVNECWKCKNDYIVSYISTNVSIPYGPSNFTQKQIDLSKQYGCKIEDSFSETMQESYLAAICPVCGAMFGDFFYHDFAYQEGDVVIKLDSNNDVLDIKINRELTLREHKAYANSDYTSNSKEKYISREKIKLNEMIQSRLTTHSGLCVRVRFDNNRNYLYNVKFPISIGDKVRVSGKFSDHVGTVIGITSSWRINKYMQQIVEVCKSDFLLSEIKNV
jgi:hypothetical protein